MTTIRKLFWHRLINGWKYQYSVWKTVFDWIVALYIVIPFSAIFIDAYLGWWRQVPVELNYIPINGFLVIFLVFLWSGTLQVFVEDADQIFLFQRKIWVKGLIKYSLVYYMIKNLLVSLLFSIVWAPFLLLHYNFTTHMFVWLTAIIFLLKASIGILKQLLEFRVQGWKLGLSKTILLFLTGVFLRQIVSLLLNRSILFSLTFFTLITALIWLIYQRMFISETLLEDISMQQASKLKFTNVLLKYAGTYTKKTTTLRTSPWLFQNSNIIFKQRNPENSLVEICIKSTLRHSSNIIFYFQVIGAYVLVLTAYPPVLKWFWWGVSIPFLIAMVKPFWLESLNNPFVSMFPLRPEIKLSAAIRSLFLMALPGEIILALIVLLLTRQWLFALILFPLGFFLSKFVAKKLAMFS
ncbi:bacterial ABC transporter protein EcsB [Desulfosporosinus acididurans]|uniref:Bacterial ABC transporter protein EcsB n=1 Tax=Desulfosporosinus acididurans TaxID=476652 RepID=A0A0J1FLU4_9FIRM|nr:ABC transporter permease [Desulfosporosinus acididurans]KLU64489.1 bacterial ABC transporter protein EcsB [Desulfosporosinus acididurans]